MARGHKPPSRCDKAEHKRHTSTVHRWAKRKKKESEENRQHYIDELAAAGGGPEARRRLFFARAHLRKLQCDAKKKEREILENTSLKDLIK
jgi:hypothetical protein